MYKSSPLQIWVTAQKKYLQLFLFDHFFSLHICSMWETICDAWACWSGWKFGANSTEYPYSVIQNTTPPPRKLKFSQILGLWEFSITEYPPPENLNLARFWDFEYFQLQNTPPPPPENWILARSWEFEYFQLQNTLPPQNLNLARSWDFEYFQLQNTPPPIPPWKLARSWDFEYFQLQNTQPPQKIEI